MTLLVDLCRVYEFRGIGATECNLLSKDLVKVPTPVLEIPHTFTAWQRRPPRHVFFSGTSHKVEDDMRLIEIAGSREDGFSFEHLAKDTSEVISKPKDGK